MPRACCSISSSSSLISSSEGFFIILRTASLNILFLLSLKTSHLSFHLESFVNPSFGVFFRFPKVTTLKAKQFFHRNSQSLSKLLPGKPHFQSPSDHRFSYIKILSTFFNSFDKLRVFNRPSFHHSVFVTHGFSPSIASIPGCCASILARTRLPSYRHGLILALLLL